ncbi:type VII secretion-associated serine protease mycosin [Actinophytocola glycyrrhizae]|uniref:Type VII secretion-associated serine protease mycosin n=1 Tax=Actinophytocola glycyrrhizae TaxID=2044873 RepID=A0ABV9RYJ1_9PSEU
MAVTRTTRVLSVLAATTLAFVPAAGPAAVAQPAGPSQPSSPTASAAQGMATPPPLPPDFPTPVDDGEPDRAYTPKTQCVQSRGSTAPLQHKPWGQDLLRFEDLGDFATGKGQKVAVIDTGVTPHDYFQNRLEGGGDYVIRSENGLKDCDGHGTEVAGIIAADPRDETIGFRGIAPEAGIVSIRQSSANYEFKDPATNTSVSAGNLGTLAKAIVRAANTPGVTVINMSVDSCRPASFGPIAEPERQVQAALRYAVEERNVVPVASAGNLPEGDCKEQNSPDPKNPTWLVIPPWFSEYVLSVAAMTEDGSVAEFSITGPWVSVAAPGTDIISLDPANTSGLANQTVDDKGNAQPIQGTSFAAPYVAGLAALVRQRFPELDARQVMERIKVTASHPAAAGGRDNLVGYGMINPMAALTAFIPAEENIPPDKPVDVPFEMPPPYERDWTPMQVAMIGSGGGVGLLLLTLFVVRTTRRNRKETPHHRT